MATKTVIDFSQLASANKQNAQIDLGGRDPIKHETAHVAAELGASSFAAASDAGKSGDKPTSMEGSAEAFATTVGSESLDTLAGSGDLFDIAFQESSAYQDAGSILSQGQQQYVEDMMKTMVVVF